MIAVPFVYFLILFFIHVFRIKKFDMACFILAIFVLTSFFSILVDVFSLRDSATFSYAITLKSVLVYCFLLTLGIIPLALFSNSSVEMLHPIKNDFPLKIISIVFFGYFVLNTCLLMGDIINVLSGDVLELRKALYRGEYESGWLGKLPGVYRTPFILLNMLMSVPWIFLFLTFYSLIVQKMKLKYCVFFFFASLMDPIVGIVGVDRSKMTYWVIAFVAVFLFFRPYLSYKQKKFVQILGVITIFFVVAYLSFVTNSRFENRFYGGEVGGSMGGLITYLGQPYINFCYFFDNIEISEGSSAVIFPFFNEYVLNNPVVGGTKVQEFFSILTGQELGVFYTYLGHILTSAGHIYMFLFSITFFFLGIILLKRKYYSKMNVYDAYIYIAVSSVSFLGVFAHYYTQPGKTFALVFFSIFFLLLSNNFKIKG